MWDWSAGVLGITPCAVEFPATDWFGKKKPNPSRRPGAKGP